MWVPSGEVEFKQESQRFNACVLESIRILATRVYVREHLCDSSPFLDFLLLNVWQNILTINEAVCLRDVQFKAGGQALKKIGDGSCLSEDVSEPPHPNPRKASLELIADDLIWAAKNKDSNRCGRNVDGTIDANEGPFEHVDTGPRLEPVVFDFQNVIGAIRPPDYIVNHTVMAQFARYFNIFEHLRSCSRQQLDDQLFKCLGWAGKRRYIHMR
ncbi:hypothetical protein ALQ33_03436 [Pseudomonas syringae pv. philadelphi]|uniref:Uncharacterized protein n=1 Tax=Pseudomonas syringae pv. philadelphi TaxID=251706 RepID=A0A3M3Z5A7_9PSED|nr:hypothetical protein ALQ33_03436 [Pseudomonas syringae pv. philadelphi]